MLVTGEGFEPSTFGLWDRRILTISVTYPQKRGTLWYIKHQMVHKIQA